LRCFNPRSISYGIYQQQCLVVKAVREKNVEMKRVYGADQMRKEKALLGVSEGNELV
jgi:hypothetical protein